MSSENQIGNTGDLVVSYCISIGLGVSELAKKTGLKEEYLRDLASGEREFSRDNLVSIIEVLAEKMDEAGQGSSFTFADKRRLLESAGYGLVAGYINTDNIPPGCCGAMPVRPNS